MSKSFLLPIVPTGHNYTVFEKQPCLPGTAFTINESVVRLASFLDEVLKKHPTTMRDSSRDTREARVEMFADSARYLMDAVKFFGEEKISKETAQNYAGMHTGRLLNMLWEAGLLY